MRGLDPDGIAGSPAASLGLGGGPSFSGRDAGWEQQGPRPSLGSFSASSVGLSPAQLLSPATCWPEQGARGLWEGRTALPAAPEGSGSVQGHSLQRQHHRPWTVTGRHQPKRSLREWPCRKRPGSVSSRGTSLSGLQLASPGCPCRRRRPRVSLSPCLSVWVSGLMMGGVWSLFPQTTFPPHSTDQTEGRAQWTRGIREQ